MRVITRRGLPCMVGNPSKDVCDLCWWKTIFFTFHSDRWMGYIHFHTEFIPVFGDVWLLSSINSPDPFWTCSLHQALVRCHSGGINRSILMVVTLGRYASLVDPMGKKDMCTCFCSSTMGCWQQPLPYTSKHLHLLRFGIWIPPRDIQNIPAKNVRCNL